MKHSLKYLFALVILLGFPVAGKTEAQKKDQNFDLTVGDNLQRTDRLHGASSYNLGATGLRGWIYHTWPNELPKTWPNEYARWGLIDDQTAFAPHQILVTHIGANTPASSAGVFAINDVIVGVNGKPFTSDARRSLANAITEAEKTAGPNNLSILRWRAGVTSTVKITLPKMGSYSATAPYNCPKTTLIMDNAAKHLHKKVLKEGWQTSSGPGGQGAISALALLATGNPEYMPALQAYARLIAPSTLDLESSGGVSPWDCYKSIFLSEYYMITGDKEVLHGLSEYVVFAAKHTGMFGTAGHGFSGTPPPAGWKAGGTHGTISWYGPVNNAGLVAQLSIVLGKKAGLVHPEIDPAIARAANFFGYYVNRGSIPYGEHEPWFGAGNGHVSNGKDCIAAVMFANIGDKPVQTEYYTRMAISAFSGEGYGHTGQGFSYLWTTLAVSMGGPTATVEFQKKMLWQRDLTRRCDGSFTYDGSEQFGCSSPNDYWSNVQYYDNPTAYYILHCAIPLKKLCITGKTVNPKTWLTPQVISSAIAAGEFPRISGGLTTAKLVTCLGDYDPIVRYYAAQDLGVRIKDRAALVPQLIAMADHPTDSNQREGACTALGYMGSPAAIPVLVRRLTDKEIWVRARAANALSQLKAERAAIEPHIPVMLAAFVANVSPTYPYEKGFNWSDPLQISNGFLSETLFEKFGDLTAKVDKKLLWPAVRAGIKQPTGTWRTKLTDFVQTQLTLEDVKELVVDLLESAKLQAPCDTMFAGSPTRAAMNVMAKFHIQEALDIYRHNDIEKLGAYGEAARWTLPSLRLDKDLSVNKNYIKSLETTIGTINTANKAPALIYGLPVAVSQIVATPSNTAKPLTLTGSSCRTGPVAYAVLTQPLHGTLTGKAPDLIYTPAPDYAGVDSFTFQTRDTLTTSLPGTVNIVVGISGTGLKGVYFDNPDLTLPKAAGVNQTINFDWGTVAPNKAITPTTYSVRWTGQVLAPETGTYRFSTRTSDGVRLWVNGVQVISNWKDYADNTWNDSDPIPLVAGQKYSLKMEYYKNVNPATVRLSWYMPSRQDNLVIPQELLYPAAAVSLTSPIDGARLGLPAGRPTTITLKADAADIGPITGVSFYNGNTLVGTATTPPYTFVLKNVVAGRYSFAARSTNSKGEVTTSCTAVVSVDLNTVPVTTGLACYYDAAVGTAKDLDDGIVKWADRSGNAHHAKLTSGAGPLLAPNQINTKPTIQIRGNGNYFDCAGQFFAKEQYVVVRSPNPTWKGNGSFLGRKNTTGKFLDGRPSSFNLTAGQARFNTDWMPAAVSMNGKATSEARVGNGVFDLGEITNFMILKIVVRDANPPVGYVSYQIGQNDNLGSCDMDLAEIIGYDHELSPADEALVGGYLSAKYGIKTSYSPSTVAPSIITPTAVSKK